MVLDLERMSSTTSISAGAHLVEGKPVDDYDKYKMPAIIVYFLNVYHDVGLLRNSRKMGV